MKWVFRIVLAVLVLVLVAGVVLYFSLNGIVKSQIQTQGTAATGVDTDVDSVNLSPFNGALGLGDFTLANPEGFGDGSVFKFNDADVKVSLASLFDDEVVVNRVHVDGAEVLVKLDGTKLNIKQLYDQIQQRTAPADPDAPPTDEPADDAAGQPVVVEDLRITNTRVLGEVKLPGVGEPFKIDLVLADIHEREVRGAELGDVIGFVVQTVMVNAGRSVSQQFPDLDQFLGGLEDRAAELADDVTQRAGRAVDGLADEADKVLPGSGDRITQEKDKLLDQGRDAVGELFGGKKKDEAE